MDISKRFKAKIIYKSEDDNPEIASISFVWMKKYQ